LESVVPVPEITPVNELAVLLVLMVKFVKPEIFPEPEICPVVDTRDRLLPPDVNPELDESPVSLRLLISKDSFPISSLRLFHVLMKPFCVVLNVMSTYTSVKEEWWP
jgi:hypothetical protein